MMLCSENDGPHLVSALTRCSPQDHPRKRATVTSSEKTTSAAPRTGKARNTDPRFSKLTIGVCPDQWGVWFPQDDKQIPWETALDEMAEAGFEIMETGPFGYFPTDPARLKKVMDDHGFRVVAGTGWGILHKAEAWPETERTFRAIAETPGADQLTGASVHSYEDLLAAEADSFDWPSLDERSAAASDGNCSAAPSA